MSAKKIVRKPKLPLRTMLGRKLLTVGCCNGIGEINGSELARRLDFSKQLVSQVLLKGRISERFAYRLLLMFPDHLTDADIKPYVAR